MRNVTILLALLAALLSACERSAPQTRAPIEIEDVVRTTTAPVDWMTRRIAGNLVPVELLCPPGEDPATWRPEPDIVAQYQQARLVIANGAEFETWVIVAPLPRSRVVRTADAITDELLVIPGETHSHGPEGTHTHDLVNGFTWLDPIHAIAQSGAIAQAMQRAFPEHAPAFTANHAELASELRALHERLQRIDLSEVTVVAPERPYGYLARRYAWTTAGPDEFLEESPIDASAPAVLLYPEAPGEETKATLRDTHRTRAVVWHPGAAASDRPYDVVLADNIERLERAIAEASP
ncbi:MAG: metal ABC transporter substrate-binding protein [Phycisphaerales bacterium]